MIIKIFGAKGEGKSTLAEWLTLELTKLGIIVENEDQNHAGHQQDKMDLSQRLKVLGQPQEPLTVTIKSIQTKLEKAPSWAK
jgi:hypothetical protein